MKARRLVSYIVGVTVIALATAQLAAAQAVVLTNPLGGTGTLCGFLKATLNVILAVIVPFLVLWLIWAGFLMVLARGNPKKLEEAKKNLTYVLFGIVIILGAWTIGWVIANTIGAIQNSSGTGASTANFNNCN